MQTDRLIEIPARHGKALKLKKGQAVRLINTHGTQVVDCWAWNAADLTDHMSMEATRVWLQRLNPVVGDTFVTTKREPILTLVEDTSPGVHDTFMAACDRHRYERLGVTEYHRNCLDNMFEGMRELGVEPPMPILASFNVFMNIAVQGDGREVAKGDVVAIIGRSGSGKSTLLRCINGLETYQSGAILADGIEVGGLHANLRELRRHVGMVFQQFNLFPHLTAAENVMLAPTVVNKTPKKEARELAAEVLAKVGLSEKMDAYPSQLSGGQQQRVAIARSLAMRPKVLLCDEITSALDPELVNDVLRVVEQLAKEGMTLILVTHEMRFARDVGTHLVFMHHGKVHETGKPKEVFAAPQTPELQQFVAGTGH